MFPRTAPPRPTEEAPASLPSLQVLANRGQYVYARNALAQSVVVGDSIVALTEAGHILIFDAERITLRREILNICAATCLGFRRIATSWSASATESSAS